MSEKCYEGHHWKAAQFWAQMEGSPQEAAKELIMGWNKGMGLEDYRRIQYPETQEFIDALADLIRAARQGEEVSIIEDGLGDSLCEACRKRNC